MPSTLGKQTYQVTVGQKTFVLMSDGKRVTGAAVEGKWMIGRPLTEIMAWVSESGGTISQVTELRG